MAIKLEMLKYILNNGTISFYRREPEYLAKQYCVIFITEFSFILNRNPVIIFTHLSDISNPNFVHGSLIHQFTS